MNYIIVLGSLVVIVVFNNFFKGLLKEILQPLGVLSFLCLLLVGGIIGVIELL